MRRFLVILLAVLPICWNSAPAAEPAARKLAEEILAITNAEGMLAEMRDQVTEMIETELGRQDIPEAMREAASKHQREMVAIIFDELSFGKMRDLYLDVYTEVFTTEELRGLIDFYRSPVGRAFAEKMPVLTKRSMELAQARLAELGPRLERLNREFIEEIERLAESP